MGPRVGMEGRGKLFSNGIRFPESSTTKQCNLQVLFEYVTTLRYSFFVCVSQPSLAFSYLRFGIACRSHLQGSRFKKN